MTMTMLPGVSLVACAHISADLTLFFRELALKSKFMEIRRKHCPKTEVYVHFITATVCVLVDKSLKLGTKYFLSQQTQTAGIIINAVRSIIKRKNLQSIGMCD